MAIWRSEEILVVSALSRLSVYSLAARNLLARKCFRSVPFVWRIQRTDELRDCLLYVAFTCITTSILTH